MGNVNKEVVPANTVELATFAGARRQHPDH